VGEALAAAAPTELANTTSEAKATPLVSLRANTATLSSQDSSERDDHCVMKIPRSPVI
jgi:hypothetical protein